MKCQLLIAIALSISAILISGCSAESHYDKAMCHLEDDEIESAVKHLQKAVDKGYVPAMRQLAMLYDEGKKIEPNREKAMKLYRKAAVGGDVEAQVLVGTYYIKKDVDKGLFWLKKAADANNSNACELVVAHYFSKFRNSFIPSEYNNQHNSHLKNPELDCINICKDYARKIALSKADITGDGSLCLGFMYQHGIDVDTDKKKAIKHFEYAAKMNNDIAITQLGIIYSDPNGGMLNYDKAVTYLNKAIKLKKNKKFIGNIQFALASIYLDSDWDGYDAEVGFMLLKEARGFSMTNRVYIPGLDVMFGQCFLYGIGTKPDCIAAIRILQPIANKEYQAAFLLGKIWYENRLLLTRHTKNYPECLKTARRYLQDALSACTDKQMDGEIKGLLSEVNDAENKNKEAEYNVKAKRILGGSNGISW